MISDQDHFEIFGTRHREVPDRLLKAGALSVRLANGNLSTITYGGWEVLRAIGFLVRDRDWGTCEPQLTDLSIEETSDRFLVRYRARYAASPAMSLVVDARICGTGDGKLTFSARFRGEGGFETSRTGFTVLHPLSGVVGRPVMILHGDGHRRETVWPDLIAPWQPFHDIRAITHEVTAGLSAETHFDGDIYEMEDQRNWTDGSFKTYVRPLALPWPYRIEEGKDHHQSISLVLSQTRGVAPIPASDEPMALWAEPTGLVLPSIGLGLRPECRDDERAALPVLSGIGARELVAHFDPGAGHDADALAGFADIGARANLPVTLELALACVEDPETELLAIAALCRRVAFSPATLFVTPSVDRQSTPPGSPWPDCPPLEDIYAAARRAFPGCRLGGGMMSYFTELNRKPVPGEAIDYLSHCTNPIVHAADDRSVMQSFEALVDVLRSVRARYPALAYRIGPSTIAMRQNPYGSAVKDNPEGRRIPMAGIDPRHNGRFGATFALAYASIAAEAGLDLLTLSTLAGPFGLVAGSREPSAAGQLRPLGKAIAALAARSGRPFYRLRGADPHRLLGFGDGLSLVLANISETSVKVRLTAESVRDLCTGSILPLVDGTVSIPPYGSAVAE